MPLTSTNNTPIPTHYLFVLYPCHQLLDSAGPLDILSTITKRPEGADITLTFAAETLDPVPLAPVPPPNADWEFEIPEELPRSQRDGGVGGRGFNVQITPDVTFDQALASLRQSGGKGIEVTNAAGVKEWRSVDVLFVPGGIGSRMYRVRGGVVAQRWGNAESVVAFLREVCERNWVRSAVLTVCTGSDLLARTGLLDGRRATTNVMAFEKVVARNNGVSWQRHARWVRSLPGEVEAKTKMNGQEQGRGGELLVQREIWTSAGISAGMDLMLWFVAEVYGRDFARAVSRRLEYEWREGVGEAEVDPYYM